MEALNAGQVRGTQVIDIDKAQAMTTARVYPEVWMTEGSTAFEDYLLPRFTVLKAFIAEAAMAGQHLLVFSHNQVPKCFRGTPGAPAL